MTRLIDADELWCLMLCDPTEQYCYPCTERIWKAIENTPTVDAVPVIRCKDCKKNDTTLCPMLFVEMKDTDYCSYAERKNDRLR